MIYNPDTECEKIMAAIRRISAIRGISQTTLARKAEMSDSALSDLWNGKSKPTLYTIFKLCNALDMTVSELLDCEAGEKMEVTEAEKELLLMYRYLPENKDSLAYVFFDMLKRYVKDGNLEKQ